MHGLRWLAGKPAGRGRGRPCPSRMGGPVFLLCVSPRARPPHGLVSRGEQTGELHRAAELSAQHVGAPGGGAPGGEGTTGPVCILVCGRESGLCWRFHARAFRKRKLAKCLGLGSHPDEIWNFLLPHLLLGQGLWELCPRLAARGLREGRAECSGKPCLPVLGRGILPEWHSVNLLLKTF